MKVAVVGTGISGLTVAHHLHRRHELVVFEADDRLGGHTHTVDVDVPEGSVAVDTGFIVFNERTYPGFVGLLDELGVASRPSDMSFAVTDPSAGLEYRATNLATLFAQRRNLARPSFHRMLVDVVRFNRELRRREAADTGSAVGPSLGDVVADGRYSRAFVDHFLVPFGSSIWSADPTTFLEFPAATYARFMVNHGLAQLSGRPRWRTVAGGSRTYVEALTAPFRDRIRLGTPVHKLTRTDAGVELVADAGVERFDHVVLAVHSDQALRLLADPSAAERDVLGAIRYQPNTATLHTDERLLPSRPAARASWNYHAGTGGRSATLTYWMNLLQGIPTRTPLLVTLNRHDAVDPAHVLRRLEYAHPVFDAGAIAAQRRRHEIQGRQGTWFAGAWWGYGFHEDGLRSGLDVVRALDPEAAA